MTNCLILGSVIVGLVLLGGPVASMLAPDDPRIWQTHPRNLQAELENLRGTTALGQDTFWLLSWSVRNSLMLGVSVAALATIIGVAVGLLAGYRGGTLDRVLSFMIALLLVLPRPPLPIPPSPMTHGPTPPLAPAPTPAISYPPL